MKQGCMRRVVMASLMVCSTLQAVVVTDYETLLDCGYQYVDPRPKSEYVAPETRLLIRFAEGALGELLNLSGFVQVEGNKSGRHAGKTTIATDGRTIVFEPSAPFAANEAVDVMLNPLWDRAQAQRAEPIQYRFYVLRPALAPLSGESTTASRIRAVETQASVQTLASLEPIVGSPTIMGNGVSLPSDFPHVGITTNRNPDDGHIFIAYNRNPHYTLILDNSGAPVWYRRGSGAEDFKVQKNGMITEVRYVGYDWNFNWVKDFRAVNGYDADSHELQVLEDGSYLLLGLRTLHGVDMSQVVDGGHPSATIHETCIQEFTAADELIFQWRAWENFDLRSLGPEHVEDVRRPSVRISHMNAIDVDRDGHLLVSSRHFSEVTKIHRGTGQVIWRLGGSHSDFVFVNDPLNGFSCQHDIRVVGDHRYTVFDNGNAHDPPISRAVEYQLDPDPDRMTATLVWEYRATPDRYAYHLGSAQRLPNGNTLINFGMPNYPKVTEVSRSGQIEFEMDFLNGGTTVYRVFRFPWTGVVESPYLVVESDYDQVTLLFNKFGDPNTAYYRIYGGLAPQPETVIGISERTLLSLRDLTNDRRYYFRVTAVDLNGRESVFSNEESILVYLYDPNEPGENMVRNGDFSQGPTDWTLNTTGSADAQWAVEEGRAHVRVHEQGEDTHSIRLTQTGLKLLRGETYVLEFEAGAGSPRSIEVKVNKKNVGSYWDYSRMGPVFLATAHQHPAMKHFVHAFVMESQTDLDGCIEIHVGANDASVYLDNVSLVRQAR